MPMGTMNIGIIGLGLMGGSLGRAIIKKTQHFVYGFDVMSDILLKAELLNAINAPLCEEDYKKLDILIFAVTPGQFKENAKKVLNKLKKGCIVSDIAGIKKMPVELMKEFSSEFPHIEFIATHPMAGKEFSGLAHSSASLFEKASMLLIPVNAELETIAAFKKLCFDIGFSFVKITDETEHDKIIAFTSQLPHIISSSYINNPLADSADGFSAGSFKDLSRVSKMNAPMWAELFLENRENILNSLDVFISNINKIREVIKKSDYDLLKDILNEGNLKKEIVDKSSREWKKINYKED